MTAIDPNSTLADLVITRPAVGRRLDELGLDYCCGGTRTVGEAIAAAGLDPDRTLADLEAVEDAADTTSTWRDVGELVDWIEATHHASLREVLPYLTGLADKVAGVHGENHPELLDVAAIVQALRADLEPHLVKEERVLFPMVRQLVAATEVPSFHCGTLSNPISVMLAEHDVVGVLLARLREQTGGFAVPPDGCGSYHALYAGLAELEADTHRHVHVENNVLFPAVVELERRLASGAPADAIDEGGEAPCWAHLFDDAGGGG